MASLGEMLASVAHQWKQPIASISSISSSLRVGEELKAIKGGESDLTVIEKAIAMEKHVKFMDSTMNDFRSFFKNSDTHKNFSLQESSQKLFSLFADFFNSFEISIVLGENSEKTFIVAAYENMYKQALLNIINNAKDAIVNTQTSCTDITISYEKENDYALINIDDCAGGIPDEIIDKIFDKHFTTKGKEGSGLGLAMSKEMVEEGCQGELLVSKIDNGSRFTIKLPLVNKD